MIDREIRDSNIVLEEAGVETFDVRGVRGVQSPRSFARDIPVSGWEPVEAEVKVSDPVHLALTLGGRNLYGRGFDAPIREIFQNAIDAVKGRRGSRSAREFPGNIRVTLEKLSDGTEMWIHFDDDGMGMPPSILTGTLIDFGKSIWSSSLLSEEYPTLGASISKPIGQFGIGFFSIFMLGSGPINGF